jgi:hypothetical protein
MSLKVRYDYDFLDHTNLITDTNLLEDSPSSQVVNYEGDQMEDLEETSENLRTQVNNFPIKLLKGVLNKHNVSILNSSETLNKNIFFSYRLNNNEVTEKIDQVEQF